MHGGRKFKSWAAVSGIIDLKPGISPFSIFFCFSGGSSKFELFAVFYVAFSDRVVIAAREVSARYGLCPFTKVVTPARVSGISG